METKTVEMVASEIYSKPGFYWRFVYATNMGRSCWTGTYKDHKGASAAAKRYLHQIVLEVAYIEVGEIKQ